MLAACVGVWSRTAGSVAPKEAEDISDREGSTASEAKLRPRQCKRQVPDDAPGASEEGLHSSVRRVNPTRPNPTVRPSLIQRDWWIMASCA